MCFRLFHTHSECVNDSFLRKNTFVVWEYGLFGLVCYWNSSIEVAF